MPTRTKIYFDGGARPNPGPMETAVVVGGVAQVCRDLGRGGSMEAEWLALLQALEIARTLAPAEVILLGDAAAVIAQAAGTAKCPRACAAHKRTFDALGGDRVRLRYVRRAQNLAGIALARHHPR